MCYVIIYVTFYGNLQNLFIKVGKVIEKQLKHEFR